MIFREVLAKLCSALRWFAHSNIFHRSETASGNGMRGVYHRSCELRANRALPVVGNKSHYCLRLFYWVQPAGCTWHSRCGLCVLHHHHDGGRNGHHLWRIVTRVWFTCSDPVPTRSRRVCTVLEEEWNQDSLPLNRGKLYKFFGVLRAVYNRVASEHLYLLDRRICCGRHIHQSRQEGPAAR